MGVQETSRRGVLVSASTVATLLTGCLGGGTPGSSSDGETSTDEDTTSTGTDQPLPAPSKGRDDADVVVKAWEDFSCPHCARFNRNIVPKLESNYVENGTVRFEHHDFPIPVHPKWSWKTAIAARSVQARRGKDAFWTFAEGAFENYSSMDWDTIRTLAEQAGADPETTVSDAKSGVYRPTVEADKNAGRERGVRGTPTVFVDGQKLEGYGYARIESAIESATS